MNNGFKACHKPEIALLNGAKGDKQELNTKRKEQDSLNSKRYLNNIAN
jgi:hypothetical protein